MANVLITGGAGFIGSHTCLALLQAGHQVVVLDDLSNGCPEALRRVADLAGLRGWTQEGEGRWAAGNGRLLLLRGDVRSPRDLGRIFAAARQRTSPSAAGRIEAVLHFAGLKSVAESVADPLRYWDVNVGGSRTLVQSMLEEDCRTLVFSSSATLYGYSERVPIAETSPVQPINPYGHTKAAVERLLADVAASDPGWRIACLRYFNPVGAHPSGRIGEAPCAPPTNLFPLMGQVAVGRRSRLQVYGHDWPTPDGTGIRDYVHVMDLAEGHRAALELLLLEPPQLLTLNLGTGRGSSVLELVRTFEAASGREIPYALCPRRPGDMAISVADPSEAERRLGWRSRRSLEEMCRDGWSWQRANPMGYSV